ALPLRNLAAAWDRFCAWRVAREKAVRLLAEPTLRRTTAASRKPVAVALSGRIGGKAVHLLAEAGTVTRLTTEDADRIARVIAGLDEDGAVNLRFNGDPGRPHIGFVADAHVNLQGSLRRSATLSARKRPSDARIAGVLRSLGLADLLGDPRGLDQRLAEDGRGLNADQTLRLDLARAVLGKVDLLVISSARFSTHPSQDQLLATFRDLTPATVIVAAPADHLQLSKAE
ncbi:MAG: hypothetical protein HC844_21565, partial [Tabrizicola sp.]|nr:hypothetical protein [Tabrizicola sp.]